MRKEDPRRRDGPWWLIARTEGGMTWFLTVPLPDGDEALAVFGFPEEAEMFLRLGGTGGPDGDGWQARESASGEVASVLCGPCWGAAGVALDPPPPRAPGGGRTARRDAMGRRRFLGWLLGRG